MTFATQEPTSRYNSAVTPISPSSQLESPFEVNEIWRDAPVFTGTTKFDPLPDVKNIMVTGGAGFIACWVVRHLVLTYPEAYNVVSFDKLDYCASLNNTRVLEHEPNFSFYRGDITNPSEVMDCLERYNIDTIFHFAAQSHVDLSFGNPFGFTHTNVYGTHVLLESARKAGIKRFIHVSTDEVYGEVKDDEDDLLETSILAPTNPYAASKAAAEMLVNSYKKSFKLPIIIVRSNNVYGPHQYPEKIIPKFTCLLARGEPVVLHGDGSPTRRYLFAGDAADAFDTILHRGQLGEIYNVGSYDEISNLSLCHKLLTEMEIIPCRSPTSSPPCNYTTSPPSSSPLGAEQEEIHRWVKYTHDRPFNDHRYAVDGTKLRKLGWEPKTTFEEGLRITVDWYRRFGERWWDDITNVLRPFPITAGGEDGVMDQEVAEMCDKPVTLESRENTGVRKSSDILKEASGSFRSRHQQYQHQHHHKHRTRKYLHHTRETSRDNTDYYSSRIPRSCALASPRPRELASSTGLVSPGITLDEDDGFDDEDTAYNPLTIVYDDEARSRKKRKLSIVVDDITNDSHRFNKKARGDITQEGGRCAKLSWTGLTRTL
ncbi:hypothetical protein GE21DRAFT_4727 [Neurospora crassa]|nr:dTDP-D-glucose 4,6-dehydratase, variant 1 [Neurospora crassa OR74A]XP_011393835.1 dTDP-D-glucose 4,6-dehydratase, variant 2 [Neurospora crassa OR74A]ESA43367.1 dTDP-D-glucose 4,6-dehydratase, variant 1 [Neurospora crassa OR74A]ESA43368.1 dTDP-D-glucose 4,6-dehydratase, variant 2 [Neurospora crassa OR74A]KHE87881.1 hypothetical protein GE21DRAFT_4727 [Neurospora crassa]|eukprot:XP_011393834.1 dTDP-D-glucose 4,6-dehydratase, variant 1 [Neurospora crassa OR74A]